MGLEQVCQGEARGIAQWGKICAGYNFFGASAMHGYKTGRPLYPQNR